MGTGGDVARGAGELGLQGLLVDVLHHAAAIEAATFVAATIAIRCAYEGEGLKPHFLAGIGCVRQGDFGCACSRVFAACGLAVFGFRAGVTGRYGQYHAAQKNVAHKPSWFSIRWAYLSTASVTLLRRQ